MDLGERRKAPTEIISTAGALNFNQTGYYNPMI